MCGGGWGGNGGDKGRGLQKTFIFSERLRTPGPWLPPAPAATQPHLPAGALLLQGDGVVVPVLLQQAGPAHAAAFRAAVQPPQLAVLAAQAALEVPQGLQELVVPEHLVLRVAVQVLLAQGGHALQARLDGPALLGAAEVAGHVPGPGQLPGGRRGRGRAFGLGEAGHHLLQGDVLAEARPGGEALSALGAVEHLALGRLVVPEPLEAGHAEVVAAGGGDRAVEHLQADRTEDLVLKLAEAAAVPQRALAWRRSGGLGRGLRRWDTVLDGL